MAKANIKTNAMRILEKANIPFQAHTYDHGDSAIDGVSVAHKLGQDEKQVFKTLVTQGASHNYYVFVIPVAKELALKAAARAVGEKSVEMIPVKSINQVTGYIRGGCSPIGMKKQFPTVLDASALTCSTIIFSGGKIGFQIEMAPQALLDLIHATTADITQ
ncbi:MAG: Cys-tRNA(Pro) deacylase [Clostridia bacterium]|nr:Cys-tRNA(Pro) deacylase [Clostridia bacterium]